MSQRRGCVAGVLGGLVLGLGWSGPVYAQQALPLSAFPDMSQPAGVSRVHADDLVLIATVEEYRKSSQISAVEGALKTGSDWRAFFEKSLGVPAAQVVWLRDDEVTRSDVEAQLDVLLKRATPRSTVWVVFVGHGVAVKQADTGALEPYLLPFSTTLSTEFLTKTALSQRELIERVEKGTQQRSVFFFDTCFSGRDQSGKALAGAQMVVADEDIVSAGVKRAKKETHVFAAATGDYARALEHYPERRPAFSYLVMGGMRGWADGDGDGVVTGQELLAYVNTFPGTAMQRPALRSTANASLRLTTGTSEREPGVMEVLRGGPTCGGVSQIRAAATSWQCCYTGQRWEEGKCVGTPQCMEGTRLWRDPNPTAGGEQRCVTVSEAGREDFDGDGVPDVDDRCPTAFARTSDGCPGSPVKQPGESVAVPTPVTSEPDAVRVASEELELDAGGDTTGVLLWSGAGASLGLGALFVGLGARSRRDWDGEESQAELYERFESSRSQLIAGGVMLGVGAALMTSAGVRKRQRREVSVGVTPGEGGGGSVAVGWSF